MGDMGQSIVMLRDRNDRGLARLDWDATMGLYGAFLGEAAESGEVVSWIMRTPSGWTKGVFDKPFRIEEGARLAIDRDTMEDLCGRLSSATVRNTDAFERAVAAGAFECRVTLDTPMGALVVASGDELDRPAKPYGIKRTYDLSPLANLATAVAWGLALERVVTEWHAWHPAARVSWDIHGDDVVLHVSFAIDGIGRVFDSVVSLYAASDTRFLYDDMAAAKANAAMAMAPHYVALAAKPANRDAALRRFADGVQR